jgi:predicted nuclease of predicted toxin-antitoxin system
MKLKLFLDEDIHTGLSHALRQRGFDVVHAQDLKRKGKSDSEQLAFAVQEERCFVTFNVRDFVNLHNQYVGQNQEHWGIIVSRQIAIGETLRRLLKKIGFATRADFKNRIEFL